MEDYAVFRALRFVTSLKRFSGYTPFMGKTILLRLLPITRSADRKYIYTIFSRLSLKHSKIEAIDSLKIK